MSIKLELPKLTDLRPRITVIGIGGAGGNAINNMIASGLSGVEFVAANTDAQALAMSSAERRLQLGVNLTEGLGAGARPDIGEAAAEEARDDIRSELSGSHMVFIAAGMGGGTGSGAAPIIAQAARDIGALTVAIVSKPFHFEGSRRMRIADTGIERLRPEVDTIIVIPNQNLFRIATERTTFAEAFVLADQVLYSGVACIVDLIMKDGLINLDFADVRTVMEDMGSAVMGTGEADGDQRAVLAAEEALANPLLDAVELEKAQGVLISIVGGSDMTLYEVDEAANRIRQEVDGEANIIVGATFDTDMGERLRVSIVAAGMDHEIRAAKPQPSAAVDGDAAVAPAATDMTNQPLVNEPQPGATQPVQTRTNEQPVPPPLPIDALFETSTQQVGLTPRQTNTAPTSNANPSSKTDQYTRALSDASATPTVPAQTWQSPQGVLIEPETDAPAAAQVNSVSGEDPTATRASAKPSASHSDTPQFQPQQPETIRPSEPRFPAVEEFPAQAQRELAAKTDGQNVASAQPARGNGLFNRLGGLGRTAESPANNAEPDTSAGPRPHARRRG